jgi:hypothetical protein
MMPCRMLFVTSMLLVYSTLDGRAQQPTVRGSATAFLGRSPEAWATQAIDDTVLIGRAQANLALARMGPIVRDAMPTLTAAVAGTDSVRRGRSLTAIEYIGPAAAPAASHLAVLVAQGADAVRLRALVALIAIGPPASDALPAIRAALKSPTASVRMRAIDALVSVDTGGAAMDIAGMLQDPAPLVRNVALNGLGTLGPRARSVLPAVIAMLDAPEPHVRNVLAPRTIGEILRDARVPEPPMRLAEVRDSGQSLRSDGRGPYVSGFDGVVVGRGQGLNLFVQGCPSEEQARRRCRNTEAKMIPFGGPPRRSILVDLRQPVASSGATARGIVRDPEGIVRVFWRRDSTTREIFPVGGMAVSGETQPVQRVQIEFVLDGRPHLLQFGPWAQGEFNDIAPVIKGNGTTAAAIRRPSSTEWIVTSGAGSVGRLWDMGDPRQPADRGLYRFTFSVRVAEANSVR